MRKIVITLIVSSQLFATTAAPVFAGGYYYGRGGGFNPLWPISAALTIPAAIIGTVANLAAPVPAVYGYAAPTAPTAPQVYSRPATYYAPSPYTMRREFM